MEITSTKDAKLLNQNWYYTGKPCKHGHYAYRYVSSNACSDCVKIRMKQVYLENRELKRRKRQERNKSKK